MELVGDCRRSENGRESVSAITLLARSFNRVECLERYVRSIRDLSDNHFWLESLLIHFEDLGQFSRRYGSINSFLSRKGIEAVVGSDVNRSIDNGWSGEDIVFQIIGGEDFGVWSEGEDGDLSVP